MIFLYKYNDFQFYFILLIPFFLSIILITLNKIFSKLIKIKSISSERSMTRGYETYEFGTHSIGSISTISNNQFLTLAILFLIFDIELIFLIPWILGVSLILPINSLLILIFAHIIMYSLLIELNENILIWYNKSTIKLI